MTRQDNHTERDKIPVPEDEATLRDLLRLANEQREVPQASYERVKHAVQAEWQKMLSSRSKAKRSLAQRLSAGIFVNDSWRFLHIAQYRAVAAGLVLVVGAWWIYGSINVERLATVETVVGDIRSSAGGPADVFSRVQKPGTTLQAGQLIETGVEGRVGLRLASGQSLRLDVNSRLKLSSSRKFVLERGAVYFDSGLEDTPTVAVVTPFGIARDIGTQFEVRVLDDSLRLRVREGEVRLQANGLLSKQFTAERGDELLMTKAGTVSRAEVMPTNEDWAWAEQLAPVFELEGKTLAVFLKWLARERGWDLLYEDGILQQYAASNVLYGSIEGLSAEEALTAVAISAGIEYKLERGVLLISGKA